MDEDDGAPKRDWRATPAFNFSFAGFWIVFGTYSMLTWDSPIRWLQAVMLVVLVALLVHDGVRALRKKRAGLQDLP